MQMLKWSTCKNAPSFLHAVLLRDPHEKNRFLHAVLLRIFLKVRLPSYFPLNHFKIFTPNLSVLSLSLTHFFSLSFTSSLFHSLSPRAERRGAGSGSGGRER